MSRKLTHEEFVQRLTGVNPGVEVLGKYNGQSETIKTRCRKCKHIWFPRAGNLLYNKSGCPECKKATISNALRKSHETFIAELKEINPDLEVLSQYNGDGNYVNVGCLVCNSEWEAKPNHLLQGHGCPKCSHTSTSFMEQFIYHAMVMAFGSNKVSNRNKSLIGSELDIVLFLDNVVAIEIGSWRFHRNTIERDKEKANQCEKKNVQLWVIFDQYDGKTKPDYEHCLVFDCCLGAEPGHKSLRRIVNTFLRDMNHSELSDSDFDTIAQLATKDSKRTTTEDFIAEVAELLPNVTVLGEYIRSNQGIKCRCNTCNSVWYPTPANIRQGHGCRVCSAKESGLRQKLTQEQYENKVREVNPHLTIIGKYNGSKNPIRVRCERHKITWDAPVADKLKRKNAGCKKCKIEAIRRQWKKTHEQYVAELKEINPNIKVLDIYDGDAAPIKVKCLRCNHKWNPQAGTLLQGRDCPNCRENRRGLSLRWTTERFDEELRKKHPGIIRLSEYRGANERIEVQCSICGEKWTPKANYLITRSKGCPNRDNH